jgi:hypothetical protein
MMFESPYSRTVQGSLPDLLEGEVDVTLTDLDDVVERKWRGKWLRSWMEDSAVLGRETASVYEYENMLYNSG